MERTCVASIKAIPEAKSHHLAQELFLGAITILDSHESQMKKVRALVA